MSETLIVSVEGQVGTFPVAAAFTAGGGVTALFGESGAGKTTLLKMIAGVTRPAKGRIAIRDHVLFDSARGIHLPPEQRRIGYVFQDARLFPHLSVRQNLDYGRRMNGLRPDAATQAHAIELLDIGHLLDRRPAQLSGGEMQRIALGRALLAKPKLLLLDEPLGSLDDERKADILPFLIRLRDDARVPMVYVSHDAEEMRQLATSVVMLKRGKVVAQGGVDILRMPA